MVNIKPLMGTYPSPIGWWGVDAQFAELVAREILDRKPNLVVECGSGSSTVLVAECLERNGSGRVISLDHDPEFAALTRSRLTWQLSGKLAEVVAAPLAPRKIDGKIVYLHRKVIRVLH